jgi:hypothetical protein
VGYLVQGEIIVFYRIIYKGINRIIRNKINNNNSSSNNSNKMSNNLLRYLIIFCIMEIKEINIYLRFIKGMLMFKVIGQL